MHTVRLLRVPFLLLIEIALFLSTIFGLLEFVNRAVYTREAMKIARENHES